MLNRFILLFCALSSPLLATIGPQDPWNRLITTDSKEIIRSIEQLAHQRGFITNARAVTYTERAFNVLLLRKHSPREQAIINHLRNITAIENSYCTLKGCYVAENSGILRKTIDRRNRTHEVVHVYGCATKKLYHKWEKLKRPKSFEKYIRKAASRRALHEMRANILDYHFHDTREQFTVHFEDGKFMQHGRPMHGRYIYVLNAAGDRLYAGVKQVGKVQHSTFTAGEPVQCAGWLFVKHGVAQYANLASGHYKPTEEAGERLRAFLSHKSRLGADAETFTISKHY